MKFRRIRAERPSVRLRNTVTVRFSRVSWVIGAEVVGLGLKLGLGSVSATLANFWH